MNKLFFFAMPALLALSLVARPSAAQPTAMTAREVLEASTRTYAGLSQYKGTSSVLGDGETSVAGEPIQHTVSTAASTVSFVRGGALKVAGTSSIAGRYEALASPTLTYIESIGVGDRRARIVDETTPDAPTSVGFLAGLAGASGGSSSNLPSLLLGSSEFSPLRITGEPEMKPLQNLGDTPCYVIEQTDAERNAKSTLWIEKDSLLLRRIEQYNGRIAPLTAVMTPEFKQKMAEMAEKFPALQGFEMPKVTTLYRYSVTIFSNDVAR